MITFNNHFISSLPSDPISENYTRQVESAAFSYVSPVKTKNAQVVAISSALAESLAIDLSDPELAQVLTGNLLISGMKPFAMNYGGHQFGQWAGQLGDGRAIALGQVETETLGNQTLQLKGAGPTPYSRHADGFAVLRSSVREYLCSEAMFGLGIPTTRALSLCLTGDKVVRDMFYDGNAKEELGAVVCRVSSSFMRFGSFQLPASRGDTKLLKQLVDYCIKQDFSHLGEPNKEVYLAWFDEVCQRTCKLVVDWMRVGFVHGVLNTDNMSIIGETIDFGPYGWIDDFDLNWTPNTTDAQGKRYCFGAQPEIGQWNLFQLANAIYPLIEDSESLKASLNQYASHYKALWNKMMANKLGLVAFCGIEDTNLFIELEELLSAHPTDMTVFYRLLAKPEVFENSVEEHFSACFYQIEDLSEVHIEALTHWLNKYKKRLVIDELPPEARLNKMNKVNPKYVLRNYLSQMAIEKAEQGDYSMIEQLQQVMQNPYDEQADFSHFANIRPEWAKNKAGCSMLSCSS